MPSLRLSELYELMLDDNELDEIQLRRKKRKEQKEKPYGVKFVRPKVHEPEDNTDTNNGG